MSQLTNEKLTIILNLAVQEISTCINVLDTDKLGLSDRAQVLDDIQKIEKSAHKLAIDLLRRLDPGLPEPE